MRETNQLGFGIKLDWGGPVPGVNGLLWLGVILGLIFSIAVVTLYEACQSHHHRRQSAAG